MLEISSLCDDTTTGDLNILFVMLILSYTFCTLPRKTAAAAAAAVLRVFCAWNMTEPPSSDIYLSLYVRAYGTGGPFDGLFCGGSVASPLVARSSRRQCPCPSISGA